MASGRCGRSPGPRPPPARAAGATGLGPRGSRGHQAGPRPLRSATSRVFFEDVLLSRHHHQLETQCSHLEHELEAWRRANAPPSSGTTFDDTASCTGSAPRKPAPTSTTMSRVLPRRSTQPGNTRPTTETRFPGSTPAEAHGREQGDGRQPAPGAWLRGGAGRAFYRESGGCRAVVPRRSPSRPGATRHGDFGGRSAPLLLPRGCRPVVPECVLPRGLWDCVGRLSDCPSGLAPGVVPRPSGVRHPRVPLEARRATGWGGRFFPAGPRPVKVRRSLPRAGVVDVRVDLGRRQVRVSERLLDYADVPAAAVERRREGVPQSVRAERLRDAGLPEPEMDSVRDLRRGEPRALARSGREPPPPRRSAGAARPGRSAAAAARARPRNFTCGAPPFARRIRRCFVSRSTSSISRLASSCRRMPVARNSSMMTRSRRSRAADATGELLPEPPDFGVGQVRRGAAGKRRSFTKRAGFRAMRSVCSTHAKKDSSAAFRRWTDAGAFGLPLSEVVDHRVRERPVDHRRGQRLE